MNPLAAVVASAGIISPENVAEMKKWGLPIAQPVEKLVFKSAEEFLQAIEQAMQSKEYVAAHETDLSMLQQFLATKKTGMLHLVGRHGTEVAAADIETLYGYTPTGEVVVPHRGDAISDLMINGETYLLTAEGQKVFFKDARELYYGAEKAFVMCTISTIENE